MVATEELCQNFSVLTILAKGSTLNYIVSSFPIFNADIIEVKFQWEQVHEDESTLFSCLCGVDSMGELLRRLLVAISSARFLSWSISALAQPGSAIHIYSRDPITT